MNRDDASKFQVGDRVYSPHFGKGIVTNVLERALYAVEVKWAERPMLESPTYYDYFTDYFTLDGRFECEHANPQFDITFDKEEKEVKENTKFKVGDRVYAPFHGYGTVIEVHEHPSVHPVVVKWDNSTTSLVEEVNSFTEDGYLSRWTKTDDTRISIAREPLKEGEEMKDVIPPKKDKKEGKFKVGDRVYFPYFGLGTVTTACDRGGYPVEVTWNNGQVTLFTSEGFLDYGDNDNKLTVVKFKVGDRVRSRGFGVGVVDEVLGSEYPYPITVKWTDGSLGGTYSSFTLEGHYYPRRSDAERDITLLEEGETMKDNKIKTDAINPPHYRVKGIPEAYDIMTHLMNREQLEGFLWGNIIKYAYRYGRKGDEAETAGKIKWYAQKLKELGECESE